MQAKYNKTLKHFANWCNRLITFTINKHGLLKFNISGNISGNNTQLGPIYMGCIWDIRFAKLISLRVVGCAKYIYSMQTCATIVKFRYRECFTILIICMRIKCWMKINFPDKKTLLFLTLFSPFMLGRVYFERQQ